MEKRVLLVRHAEPDYEAVGRIGNGAAARNVAPLTADGRLQAVECAGRLGPVTRIVTSPMTRTLQTASLMARALSVECEVEVDLREWDSGTDGSASAFAAAAAEYRRSGGAPPPTGSSAWESASHLRRRATAAVERWSGLEGVVVLVTHAFVIEALTGVDGRTVEFCDVVPLGGGFA